MSQLFAPSRLAPSVRALFPRSLLQLLEQIPSASGVHGTLEEVRIRQNRPLEISYNGKYVFVCQDGRLTTDSAQAYRPDREDCRAMLELTTNHSLYAMEEELRRGYVTVPGGHRIGLAGRALLDQGRIAHLRDIASFNVRIAREVVGSAAGVIGSLLDKHARTVKHTLIISPPQQGKTTLIRELARCISAGQWHSPETAGWGGRKVCVVDERSEIAACDSGVPSFDLGPRSDVLDACPKAEGMMMAIRALSPEVLVVDEIGRPEDAFSINEAIHAGVRVLATAHATDVRDALARPVLAQLMKQSVFSVYVVLTRQGGYVRHRIVQASEAAGDESHA